jgi:hypothetical protein
MTPHRLHIDRFNARTIIMSKINYTATDANGIVHKRSTKARSYTHTVVVKRSYEADIAAACEKHWTKSDISNFAYYRAIAEDRSPHYPSTRWCAKYPDKWTPAEIAEEDARLTLSDAVQKAKAITATEGHSVDSYVAFQKAQRIARVDARKAAGYYDQWESVGWCGRLDLALKLAGSQKNVAATDVLVAVEA